MTDPNPHPASRPWSAASNAALKTLVETAVYYHVVLDQPAPIRARYEERAKAETFAAARNLAARLEADVVEEPPA